MRFKHSISDVKCVLAIWGLRWKIIFIWSYSIRECWSAYVLFNRPSCIYIYIYISELSWQENPANTYMWHTEHWTAVSILLDLISSAHHRRLNQQPQYAEAETLPLGHRFMQHISDAKLTSHGDNARPLNLMCLEGANSLQRTRPPPGLRLPKPVLWIHITLTSWTC